MRQGAGAPLNVRELPALLERVHHALELRRQSIDDLNVFPVPDGDTGTNMTATVRAGLDALHDAGKSSPREISRRVIRGAVGGARGNSGVILSQVIRAVVEAVAGRRRVDADLYAAALVAARELAYEAVAEPVEGTMLSAISAAADAARQAAASGADLVATSLAAFEASAIAVERTPEQLDVLRAAGVVDAGARGFEIVLAAVHGHLTGAEPEVVEDRPANFERQPDRGCHASLANPFEVQYLLDAQDAAAATLRAALESLGDSVVVVAAGGLLNVHVHTADVGATIEAGLQLGRPSKITVTHFGDQIAARAARRRQRLNVVAVVDGAGLAAMCRTVGAAVVTSTDGGLPAVSDLLEGLIAAEADTVVLLPGNRNVRAAASQAAGLAEHDGQCHVRVIHEADSPPAVLAALAVFDAEVEPDALVHDMRAAAHSVRAGAVVAAARDAQTPLGIVDAGQALAVYADGTVVGVGAEPLRVLAGLCDALDARSGELITLIIGEQTDAALERDARAMLTALAPEATLDVVSAGQRNSWFWVGVE